MVTHNIIPVILWEISLATVPGGHPSHHWGWRGTVDRGHGGSPRCDVVLLPASPRGGATGGVVVVGGQGGVGVRGETGRRQLAAPVLVELGGVAVCVSGENGRGGARGRGSTQGIFRVHMQGVTACLAVRGWL